MNRFFININQTTLTSLLGVFVVFIYLPLKAQIRDTATNKTQHINEIVVTGQYGENSLSKSVYKMRIIDSKKIADLGAVNLRDVLSNEMNVRVTQDPMLGSSLSIQGVGGQNIKMLIDGVPVIGRENGSIDLTQINLNNIERIEVVEGPMSVSFGTDALGGVVNLITKKSERQKFKTGVHTFYETNGQYNADAFVNGNIKGLCLSASGGRNFFEGYNPDPSTRFKLWKPREQYFADASVAYSFSKTNIKLSGQWFNEKVTSRDSGVITPYYAYGLDQYFYTRRLTNSLFLSHKFNKGKQADIVASYSGYRRISNTMRKDLVTLDEKLVPSADQQDTNNFTLMMSRGTFSKNEKGNLFNYQAGYETNYESSEGNKIREYKQSVYDVSVFGSTEMHYKRLLVRPGLRLTYNSVFSAPVIPSLNVKYDVTEKISVRASYGKGYRTPSLKELYLNFVDPSHNVQGNENLKPETGDNFQLSLQYQYQFSERVFRVEPSLFYNHITNMISLARMSTSTLEARYINIDEFQSTGANFNMEYRAPHYALVLGYSYTGKNNSLMHLTSQNTFFFSHEARANFSYIFQKPDLNISLFYKYNGKIQNYQYDIIGDKVTLGYIDPFSLFDITAGKNFLNKSLRITTGVRNIFNVTNVAASISAGVHSTGSNSTQAAMGRTLFVSLSYTFTR